MSNLLVLSNALDNKNGPVDFGLFRYLDMETVKIVATTDMNRVMSRLLKEPATSFHLELLDKGEAQLNGVRIVYPTSFEPGDYVLESKASGQRPQ